MSHWGRFLVRHFVHLCPIGDVSHATFCPFGDTSIIKIKLLS